eukprot:m.271404 g.271404  ORF g.271404 m.271404 type:complete len:2093 (+) comp17671_c2_seq2:84-6362(+)
MARQVNVGNLFAELDGTTRTERSQSTSSSLAASTSASRLATIDFDEPSIQLTNADVRQQRRLRTKSMAAIQIQEDQHTPLSTIKAPAFEDLYLQLKRDFEDDAVVSQLLESAASDVALAAPQRAARVKSTGLSPSEVAATKNLFSRKCLEYYIDTWHRVYRKSEALSHTPRKLPNIESLPINQYAVDMDQGPQSVAQLAAEVQSDKTYPTHILLSNQCNCMRDVSGVAPATKSKKESNLGFNLITTKLRKRYVEFCFQTSIGPPVLKVYKDDKKGGNPDFLNLSSLEGVELEDDSSFVLELPQGVFRFQFDTSELCLEWADTIEDQIGGYRKVDVVPDLTAKKGKTRRKSLQDVRVTEVHSRAMAEIQGKKLFDPKAASVVDGVARTDIFGAYGREEQEALSEDHLDVPVISEAFDCRLVVECNELLFDLQARTSSGKLTNPEPFYCSLHVINLDAKSDESSLLSERFYFDLNGPEMGACVLPTAAVDLETRSRRAIFSVNPNLKRAYFVLLVEKTLQGDLNSVSEVYINAKPMDGDKQSSAASAALQRNGDVRMPFVWACRPVFKGNGQIDRSTLFSSLFRHDTDTLTEEGLLRAVQDYDDKLTSKKGSSKVRHTVVGGRFEAGVVPYEESASSATITPTLEPVLPMSRDSDRPPRREVLSFRVLPVQATHTQYINLLYVYPVSLNLNSKKVDGKSKARNVLCTVQLLDSDAQGLKSNTMGGRVIFGRSNSKKLTTTDNVTVQYHSKTPNFEGEIKMALPTQINASQHVLFTFTHVSVKSRKDRAPARLGFAFLPLEPYSRLDGGVTSLRLASSSGNYPDNLLLPPNYAREQHLGLSKTAGANLKWVDRSELFQVRARLVSTIHTQDKTLNTFFEVCASRDQSAVKSEAKLKAATQALHDVDLKTMFAFQPVLFNQLLELLQYSAGDAKVGLEAVRYLIFAVGKFHQDITHKPLGSDVSHNALLSSYVEHVACMELDGQRRRLPVHTEMVKHILELLSGPDNQYEETLYQHAWFFFRVIYKSMAYTVAASQQGWNTPRNQRFSTGFLEQLYKLYMAIGNHAAEKSNTDHGMARAIMVDLARFMVDLLSVADRGVCFRIIEGFFQHLDQQPDKQGFLLTCRYEYLRIVCNYEHYVALNLPLTGKHVEESITQLSMSYKDRHYLAWLLLDALRTQLRACTSVELRVRAIANVRNLLGRHDVDPRFQTRERRERVASLYFPLVMMAQEFANLFSLDGQASKQRLGVQETQDMIISTLYVLKNFNRAALRAHWLAEGLNGDVFLVLSTALEVFSYRGRKLVIERCLDTTRVKHQSAVKQLGELYSVSSASLGSRASHKRFSKNISAASVFSANTPPGLSRLSTNAELPVNGAAAGSRLRTFSAASQTQGTPARPKVDHKQMEDAVAFEATMSAEVSLTVLDLTETMLGFHTQLSANKGQNELMAAVFKLLLRVLQLGPSDRVVQCLFSLLRRYVVEYRKSIFNPSVDYCRALCVDVLQACNSRLPGLQKEASTLLYIMLLQDSERMGLNLMVAISETAGSNYTGSDERLRTALKYIARLAKKDSTSRPSPVFAKSVADLMAKAETVLVSTAQLKTHSDDPETLVDLQSDIAASYAGSAQLRLTWLESMAKVHSRHEQWSEAAMCVLHSAALVAECIKRTSKFFHDGALAFVPVSHNVKLERKMASDASDANDLSQSSPIFSDKGVLHLLRVVVTLLKKAQRFELVSRAYMRMLPILEDGKRYEELTAAAKDLHGVYGNVVSLNQSNKRILATYYRVRFHGRAFARDNGKEYIYKEPNVTPLASIKLRLEALYSPKFRTGEFEIITDSKELGEMKLDSKKAYLQITHVEPHWPTDDEEAKKPHFELHHEVRYFIYSTPFTKSGKARGEIADQCMRKTVLTMDDGLSFPHIRKRLLVEDSRKVEVLEPLDVAVEEMSKKVAQLRELVHASQPDMKLLQMQLQGALSLQVNAGPLEYARVFLSKTKANTDSSARTRRTKLTRLFELMIELLEEGVDLNSRLIATDQHELQADLQAKLGEMKKQFAKTVPALREQRNAGRRSLRKYNSLGRNASLLGGPGPVQATADVTIAMFNDVIPA